MKYIIVSFLLIATSLPSNAQWSKIADFVGTDGSATTNELITCIYFLDHPGPPRIGFVGSESELHKTTDGGKTWYSVWNNGRSYSGYYVTGICFKDSLIGWFSISNNFGITGDQCYKTTDGGESWKQLNVPNEYYSDGDAIYYDSCSNRLFLSLDKLIRISKDLGNSWSDSLPYAATTFSFNSCLYGISVTNFFPDTTFGYIVTSNEIGRAHV